MWKSMKNVLSAVLAAMLLGSPLCADQLDDLNKETDRLWRRGRGAEDGAFYGLLRFDARLGRGYRRRSRPPCHFGGKQHERR